MYVYTYVRTYLFDQERTRTYHPLNGALKKNVMKWNEMEERKNRNGFTNDNKMNY